MYDNHGLIRHLCDRVDLTGSEKLVALLIARHRNAVTGLCFPSQKRLGALSGLSRGRVNRVVRELKLKRVLYVRKVRSGKSVSTVNSYVFRYGELIRGSDEEL